MSISDVGINISYQKDSKNDSKLGTPESDRLKLAAMKIEEIKLANKNNEYADKIAEIECSLDLVLSGKNIEYKKSISVKNKEIIQKLILYLVENGYVSIIDIYNHSTGGYTLYYSIPKLPEQKALEQKEVNERQEAEQQRFIEQKKQSECVIT
jgi:hypothetical protein